MMKRGNIIALAFVAYLVAMVAMFFSVNSYITSKDNRLRNEMHDKIVYCNSEKYCNSTYHNTKTTFIKSDWKA